MLPRRFFTQVFIGLLCDKIRLGIGFALGLFGFFK